MSVQEYFDITVDPATGSLCTEELVNFSWSLIQKELTEGDDPDIHYSIFKIFVKMETEQYYYNITNLDQLYSAFYRPNGIPVSFNGSTITYSIEPNLNLYYQWLLNSESILYTDPRGNGVMTVKREYVTSGRDWNLLPRDYPGIVGAPLFITAAKTGGAWFDRISYEGEADESDNETTTAAYIDQTELRQKTFSVSIVKEFDDVSEIKFPSDGSTSAYVPTRATLAGIYNSTGETDTLVADKLLYPFTVTDFNYHPYFIITGEEFTPTSTRGGKMMRLVTNYATLGAQERRLLQGDVVV